MVSRVSMRRRAVLACLSLFVVRAPRAMAAAQSSDPAVARIETFYDALLSVMKEARALGVRGRYDKLAPTIRNTFDLAAMIRIAVGPEWNSIAPEQQTVLTEAFAKMTIATYANRFDGYSGERFEADPNVETRNTGKIVRTKLIQSSGEPIMLNYLMRGSGNEW